MSGGPRRKDDESVERVNKQMRSRSSWRGSDTPREHARETQRPRETKSGPVAKALTSHVGVLVIFPSLVFLLGVFLTFTSQRALRESNLELAEARMKDDAALVSEHLASALGQADFLLDNLETFAAKLDPSADPTLVAVPLKRLIYGRAGASYVSLSYPDGTFAGAFVDRDGQIRFQVSRVLRHETEERVYSYQAGETLVLQQIRASRYDPRTRPFYRLAQASSGRVWTEPYTFAGTYDTGITRTVALREGTETKVVLTIDYDVRRLSPLLMRDGAHSARPILFDSQGTILADPQLKLTRGVQGTPSELLNYRTLSDPVLTAFFAADPSRNAFLSFSTPAGPYLAAVARLEGEGRPDWAVAFMAPEASFLSTLEAHARRSYWVAGAALVIATLLSAAFARLIVRVRREAAEAREAARRARIEAKELGSYRLIERLGVGGMGEVWRAEHRLLARRAAIKLIKSEGQEGQNETARKRFEREAKSLASLRSRNTIEIFDYGVTEEGTFFYVMELLDGLDLDTLVARDGPQPLTRVIPILVQACNSLDEAHQAGLVHRDIKPANIFICRIVDELDIVKVLDFGLVRTVSQAEPVGSESFVQRDTVALGPPGSEPLPSEGGNVSASGPRLTRADHIMGTPEFMAPEQALGSEVDARTDIYALGCVAFWLLTGKTLFSGKSMLAQIAAHIAEVPPRLQEHAREPLPPSFAELIDSCLAKSPAARPQTARELRERLLDVQSALPSWQPQSREWWSHHCPPPSVTSAHPEQGALVVAPTQVLDRARLRDGT